MEAGSLNLIVAIISILGVGVALAAVFNYSGLTAFFQMVVQILGGFVDAIKAMISWAPKPVRIGIFLVSGLVILGTLVNMVMSVGYVCVEDAGIQQVYGGSYVAALIASTLPGPSLDDEGPYARGTFLNSGENLREIDEVNNGDSWAVRAGVLNNHDDFVMVPMDYNVSEDMSLADRALSGQSLQRDRVLFVFCRDDDTGMCELKTSADCGIFSRVFQGKSIVGSVAYEFVGGGIPLVNDSNIAGIRGSEKKSLFATVNSGMGDEDELCLSETEKAGSGLGLITGSAVVGDSVDVSVDHVPMYASVLDIEQNDEELLTLNDGYMGTIEARYISAYNFSGESVYTDFVNKRADFVRRTGSLQAVPYSDGDAVSRVCESDGSIGVRVFGFNVFSLSFIVIFLIGIAIIQFIRWLS